MTYPQAPVPAPAAPPPGAVPPPVGPGQDQPVSQDQTQPPAPQDQQGGQSATDAAGDDPMAWLAAAEMDTRYQTVDRPMLQTGQVG